MAYRLNDKQQFRLSYGRTVNRPEFREVSSSVYYDFDLASNVQGNYNLKPAYIDNLDFGYELYPSSGELISVSLFYKRFKILLNGLILYPEAQTLSIRMSMPKERIIMG